MIAFALVGAAAVAAAIGVITARSGVRSVLWLIVHLCSLAVLYLTLHAEFLGLVQVLIYAGVVMVLFLFVLSLLSARSGAPAPREQPPGQLFWGVLAAVVVAGAVILAAILGLLAPAAQALPKGFGGVAAFGQALFGPFLLPFEGTALALLTAIVTAVALSAGGDEAVRARAADQAPAVPAPEGAPIEVSHAAHAERTPGTAPAPGRERDSELVAGGERR